MHIPSSHIINTAEESQLLDRRTSDEFGIDPFTLMEMAGSSAAKQIWDETSETDEGLFLCGKGNNGGDALVAARYLAQKGIVATVLFVSGRDELSPLAQKNVELLQKIEQNDDQAIIRFVNSWDKFDESFQPGFIVDGMLGTGLNSNLRGDIGDTVEWANQQEAVCYAMDIPTGLHADIGSVMGNAIHADTTFSFGTLKQGFYLNEGQKYCGNIQFCELPFPDYLKEDRTYLIDDSWLPPLKNELPAHKYEAGVVYIIAGSEGLTGAAIMAARSAWQSGVGAVILVCPRGLLPIFETTLPEVIKKPVGTPDQRYFSDKDLKDVLNITKKKDGTVLIGPGLGREEETVQFTAHFLNQTKKDCVVDADALWALAQQGEWQLNDRSTQILTPHPGELHTLLDHSLDDDLDRVKKVRQTAAKNNITLLSKGFPVLVGTKKGDIYLSDYDSRHFSRAGFGDVLAGKVAAFSALKDRPEAACMRALLSGEKKIAKYYRENANNAAEPKDTL